MKYLTKLFAWSLPTLLFVFFSVTSASAFFVQTGDTITLPKEKKINEAAFISGSTLIIDSNIEGDLYCAGRDIIVNGSIKGDIVCVGQSIKINGTVDGNIRAVAMNIEVTGQVTRNITVVSQTLVLGLKSQVKGDIFFGVQNVALNGIMGRDLAGAGESITISGSLLRNASVTGSILSVIETGKIGGNLDYYMEETATPTIDEKNIKGTITRHDIETPSKQEVEARLIKASGGAFFIKTLISILSFIILGFALVYFDRKSVEKRITLITNRPFIMGLIGFAVLITAPIAFLLLLVTVIGMPLAFVAMPVYIAAAVAASLYPSTLYGKLFMEKLLQKKSTSLYKQISLGVILLGVVSIIPIIGWVVAFVSFCLGLGAIFTSLLPEKK